MRVTTLLALLFFLAAASPAAAATKVIRFGRLIDGTGRVLTNAVVIVEDDRVLRVATGNVPIPPGAEVIDLSRYTGLPGLIDAHTHITYYWDGVTTPRSEPARHPAVVAVLAQENVSRRSRRASPRFETSMRPTVSTSRCDAKKDKFIEELSENSLLFFCGADLRQRRNYFVLLEIAR